MRNLGQFWEELHNRGRDGSWQYEQRILINNDIYTESDLLDLTKESGNASESFIVGGAFSSRIEFTTYITDRNILIGDKVVYQIRLIGYGEVDILLLDSDEKYLYDANNMQLSYKDLEDFESDWIDFGHYYVNKIDIIQNNLRVECFDKIQYVNNIEITADDWDMMLFGFIVPNTFEQLAHVGMQVDPVDYNNGFPVTKDMITGYDRSYVINKAILFLNSLYPDGLLNVIMEAPGRLSFFIGNHPDVPPGYGIFGYLTYETLYFIWNNNQWNLVELAKKLLSSFAFNFILEKTGLIKDNKSMIIPFNAYIDIPYDKETRETKSTREVFGEIAQSVFANLYLTDENYARLRKVITETPLYNINNSNAKSIIVSNNVLVHNNVDNTFYTHTPFITTSVEINPALELGDTINVSGEKSNIWYMKYSKRLFANVNSP